MPLEETSATKLLLAPIVSRHEEHLHHIKQMVCGGVAGCVAKTAVAPLSRVTILMQVQSMRPHKFVDGAHPNNQFLIQSLKKIVKEEGIRGFWVGNGAMVVHRFPYTGMVFEMNALAKHRLQRWFPELPAHSRNFLSAGVSAWLSLTFCYPLDVVKTRLTTQTKTKYYKGIIDALIRIGQDEGFYGFYRGLGLSTISVVPMIAVNFSLYEYFFKLYAGFGAPLVLQNLLAGGSSGAMASTIFFPVDLLRRQMQMVGVGGRKAIYGSAWDAVKQVYRTGYVRYPGSPWSVLWGLSEFFRGLFPELIKVTPYNGIMFTIQNWMMQSKWYMES